MSRLIDVSRNKQLQKKLIRYAEQDSYPEQSSEQEGTEGYSTGDNFSKPRKQNNIRVRDAKKKKKTVQDPNFSFNLQGQKKLVPLSRSASKSKRESSSSRVQTTNGSFVDGTVPIAEKPRKKKKKYERFEEQAMMPEIPSLNSVQNVETFKNFLL